ncbi:ion channel [Sphingomonas sp. 2R-10]|uniref:potassium channel family protein n=1 Tax=Sphingomonas sp. 2R-10 TaxID=3045148 RepID=UPI000F79DD25|nr:potassium channel family protein [Sphingomonas sp. 2R-10]MDJ0278779.1 ion channel [Sphingomonas sp. 2R-10]
MTPFSLGTVLRRLYLAASELHRGVLFALLVLHMTISWELLSLAGEADLRPLPAYLYWYATTASTVGYGDLSPKSDMGRVVTALFVMPGAIALFTVSIARAFAGVAARWRRRRMGLGEYSAMRGHIVLVGYDPDRTPRMIAEIVADGQGHELVLVATQELAGDAATHRLVRAPSLTASADLRRAGVATAERVIVYGPSDPDTLAATLAVTALNETGHVVCFLRDSDTAHLLSAHCPQVEVVLTPTVELVVKALSDPGSSRLIAQLASHTDDGGTLYATTARIAGSFDDAARDLRARGGILVATCGAGHNSPVFDLEGQVAAGDRLFYIARTRIAA